MPAYPGLMDKQPLNGCLPVICTGTQGKNQGRGGNQLTQVHLQNDH